LDSTPLFVIIMQADSGAADQPFKWRMPAKGHIEGFDGSHVIIDGPINDAHFESFDCFANSVTIQANHKAIPPFWLAVTVDVDHFNHFATGDLKDPTIPTAEGHIRGVDKDGQRTVNAFKKIDGARFHSYDPDTKTITIRVVHSTIPAFWMEFKVSVAALNAFVAEEAPQEEDDNDDAAWEAAALDAHDAPRGTSRFPGYPNL
jgi:hypothetical protein